MPALCPAYLPVVYGEQDPKLHFNATKYGSVMSAISVPNLFMPFFGGMFLDAKGHKNGIVLFLMIELIGGLLSVSALVFGVRCLSAFDVGTVGKCPLDSSCGLVVVRRSRVCRGELRCGFWRKRHMWRLTTYAGFLFCFLGALCEGAGRPANYSDLRRCIAVS